MTLILDGNVAAQRIQEKITQEVQKLKSNGPRPGLAIVLVGEDPASKIYVERKKKVSDALGYYCEQHKLPGDTKEKDLLALIGTLNLKQEIHGILVQLPLPPGMNVQKVIEAVDPKKDVDGMHPLNLGRLMAGLPGLRSCTPMGVMALLHHYGISIAGKEAVVIGRSLLVGMPMAQLLVQAHGTVNLLP